MGQVRVRAHFLQKVVREVQKTVVAVPAKVLIREKKQGERVIEPCKGKIGMRLKGTIVHPTTSRHQKPTCLNKKDL